MYKEIYVATKKGFKSLSSTRYINYSPNLIVEVLHLPVFAAD